MARRYERGVIIDELADDVLIGTAPRADLVGGRSRKRVAPSLGHRRDRVCGQLGDAAQMGRQFGCRRLMRVGHELV